MSKEFLYLSYVSPPFVPSAAGTPWGWLYQFDAPPQAERARADEAFWSTFTPPFVPPAITWGWHFEPPPPRETQQLLAFVESWSTFTPPIVSLPNVGWLFDTGIMPNLVVRDEPRMPHFFSGARLGDPQPLPPWAPPSVGPEAWTSPTQDATSWTSPAQGAKNWAQPNIPPLKKFTNPGSEPSFD